jgi:hypothetical protein
LANGLKSGGGVSGGWGVLDAAASGVAVASGVADAGAVGRALGVTLTSEEAVLDGWGETTFASSPPHERLARRSAPTTGSNSRRFIW